MSLMVQPTIQSSPSAPPLDQRAAAPGVPVAFVTCIEAGGLELQVLRMVKSLRRFGGRFAAAPVYAVNPRFGLPVARTTRAALDASNVIYRRIRPDNPYPWNSYLNKPLALIDAQEQSEADAICWLDGDILVLNEPSGLVLDDEVDFLACAPDRNIGAIADDPAVDPHAAYWHAVARVLGRRLEDSPWITTHRDQQKIRLYFNSGVFTYRRSSRFANPYMQDCRRLLDAKIASRGAGIFFVDQVALGLTMLNARLRWKALPHTCNYAIGSKIESLIDPQKIRDAIILHYHDAMWPKFWPKLLALLKASRPEVHDWLAPQGPLADPHSLPVKAINRLLGNYRKRKRDKHQSQCEVF